jgi:hypothetical protein
MTRDRWVYVCQELITDAQWRLPIGAYRDDVLTLLRSLQDGPGPDETHQPVPSVSQEEPSQGQERTALIERLRMYRAVWGALPSIAPHPMEASGFTTGAVIADTAAAADALEALSSSAPVETPQLPNEALVEPPGWVQIRAGGELRDLVCQTRARPKSLGDFLLTNFEAQQQIWRWFLKWRTQSPSLADPPIPSPGDEAIVVTVNEQGDAACQHGTAMDVHCCNCHSGFLFDAATCVCEVEESHV